MEPGNVAAWGQDWAWGVPLIIVNVIFHAFALGLINKDVLSRSKPSRVLFSHSYVVVGMAALSATVFHAVEVVSWAVVYSLLGATSDPKAAMLYSLNAMTSYGHANLYLAPRWQMTGALEALNGWILFGLTTAFLFSVVQKAWEKSLQSA